MFDLKPIKHAALGAAQKKAMRYRLLNEPRLAESICRDILAIDPDHRDALVTLVLALSDQYGPGSRVMEAMELTARLESDYDRHYYNGIACERKGIAVLRSNAPGSGPITYDWLRRAMEHFEAAEKESAEDNDDAVLRWNTCARIINTRAEVSPMDEDRSVTLLE